MSDYINGTYKVLSIKVDKNYLPVGCLTDNSFEESVDMLDTTVRTNANGWRSSRPITQNYSISFSGLVTADSLISGILTYNDLRNIKRGRQLIEWKISADVGADEYGSGYITNLSDTAPLDDFVSFSGGIVGVGEPTVNPNIEGALDEELNFEL